MDELVKKFIDELGIRGCNILNEIEQVVRDKPKGILHVTGLSLTQAEMIEEIYSDKFHITKPLQNKDGHFLDEPKYNFAMILKENY